MSAVARRLALVMTLISDVALGQSPADLGCAFEPGPKRTVAQVLDGSTVELDDRSVVRLLGLLTPRSEDAGAGRDTLPGEAASHAALKNLALGRSVTLAFAGPRSDRHGRVLAHLFLDDGGTQVWVQGRLVESGAARVFLPPGSEMCVSALLKREAAARGAGLGLWSAAMYAVRPADRPTELARYQGTFQLVLGRLAHVQVSRTLTVLHFESAEAPRPARTAKAQERPQHGARVLVRHGTAAARALGNPKALNGRSLLVRGWIEGRGSPEIEIVAVGQIEVEAEDMASGRPGAASPNAERPAEGPPGAGK